MRFKGIWDRVPEDMKPWLEQLIDEYNAKYGTKANRVSCDLSHRAGTHIKKLTCRFTDECSIHIKTIAGIARTPELVASTDFLGARPIIAQRRHPRADQCSASCA